MSTELAVAAKDDNSLMEELWNTVRRLIGMWAYQYSASNIEDLIQSGYIALYDAVQGYNPDKGMKFTSYLKFHIQRRFDETAGRRGAKYRPDNDAVSLHAPLGEETDTTMLDMLQDPSAEFEGDLFDKVSKEQDCAALMKEIDKLPEDMRKSLLLTSWDGYTVKQAADIMQVPAKRVEYCRKAAARTIRATKTARIIGPDYHISLSRFRFTHTSIEEEYVLLKEQVEEMRLYNDTKSYKYDINR